MGTRKIKRRLRKVRVGGGEEGEEGPEGPEVGVVPEEVPETIQEEVPVVETNNEKNKKPEQSSINEENKKRENEEEEEEEKEEETKETEENEEEEQQKTEEGEKEEINKKAGENEETVVEDINQEQENKEILDIVNKEIDNNGRLQSALEHHGEIKQFIKDNPMAGIGISFLEEYFPKNAEKLAKFLDKNKDNISKVLKQVNIDNRNYISEMKNLVDNSEVLTPEEKQKFEENFTVEQLKVKIDGVKQEAKSSASAINAIEMIDNGKPLACVCAQNNYKKNQGGKRKTKKSKKSKKSKSKKSNKKRRTHKKSKK